VNDGLKPSVGSTSEDLEKYVEAQTWVLDRVMDELAQGRKQSHWMWFVFPQIAGLGRSEMSRRYAIRSLEEARAYLAHPVLGERLRQCTRTLLATAASTAEEIFGPVDARKLKSSMTLFHRADPDAAIFREVLDRWFEGRPDMETDRLLNLAKSGPRPVQ
jgi:uncharacterized protein (DUF1810 family)